MTYIEYHFTFGFITGYIYLVESILIDLSDKFLIDFSVCLKLIGRAHRVWANRRRLNNIFFDENNVVHIF